MFLLFSSAQNTGNKSDFTTYQLLCTLCRLPVEIIKSAPTFIGSESGFDVQPFFYENYVRAKTVYVDSENLIAIISMLAWFVSLDSLNFHASRVKTVSSTALYKLKTKRRTQLAANWMP